MDEKLYLQMREIEDDHWWFAGRRAIVGQVLRCLHLPEHAKILDAGCGTGGNLQLLSQFGDVTAIELDDRAAEMARTRGSWPVLKGSLPDDIPFSGEGRFDLIVLLDVLEHIDNDVGSLVALSELLSPEGYLVITVPAFPILWSAHDDEHHHKRRYRAESLANTIHNAGLQLKHMSYFNAWLFPVVATIRLMRRVLPSATVGGDVRLTSSILNTVLRNILSSERHLVSRAMLPFGVSLLAVVRHEQSYRL